MEGIEDIPGIALAEGLFWDWQSFPDYLNALERQEHVIDVAAQMPHHALRVYVMGDRAIRHKRATASGIVAMATLIGDANRAGAFGFTTSRTYSRKTMSGAFVSSRYSGTDELLGIGREFGRIGAGVFGMISDFGDKDAELEEMTQLGVETGRPL